MVYLSTVSRCRRSSKASKRLPQARSLFLFRPPILTSLPAAEQTRNFGRSLLLSDLCPPDGMPIIWIARLIGLPIKRRTAGSDIFEALRQRPSPQRPLKIFLFGATERDRCGSRGAIKPYFRQLRCVGWVCPGFVSVEELSQDHYIHQINASNADFLVCALGAKKGQLWLLRNHSRLRIPVRAHLGATINFEAGTLKRAPLAVQRMGLEWLWRIKEEPSLFGRYWHDGWVLLRILLTQVLPLIVAEALAPIREASRIRHDFVMVTVENAAGVTVQISGNATADQVQSDAAHFHDALVKQRPLKVDLSQTGRSTLAFSAFFSC